MTALEARILVINKKIKDAASDGKTELIITEPFDYVVATLMRNNGFLVEESIYEPNTGSYVSKIKW